MRGDFGKAEMVGGEFGVIRGTAGDRLQMKPVMTSQFDSRIGARQNLGGVRLIELSPFRGRCFGDGPLNACCHSMCGANEANIKRHG